MTNDRKTLTVWFGEEAFGAAYAKVRNQSRSLPLVSADDIDRWREAAGPVVLAKMFEWSVTHIGYAPDVANMAGDYREGNPDSDDYWMGYDLQFRKLADATVFKMEFSDECAEPAMSTA